MANEIVSEITLDLSSYLKSLKEAEKMGKESGQQVGENFGSSIEKAFSSLTSIKSMIIGLGSALVAGLSVKSIVAEAVEAENAMHSLRASLAIAGQDASVAGDKFQKYAEQLQRTTGFSDDAIIKNASLLVSIGKLSGEGLERATLAAANLSAGLGISLDTAMEKVARAAAGNTEAFGKLGIKIKDTGSEAGNFQALLSRLEGSFGGMAQGQLNTFDGALTRVKNSFNDLLEELGKIITRSPFMMAALKAIAGLLDQAAAAVTKFAGSGDVIGQLATKFLELSRIVIQNVLPPIELLYNLLKTGTLTILTGLTMIVQGLSVVGQAILDVMYQPILDVIGAVGKLVSVFDADLGASFTNFAAGTLQSTQTALAQLNVMTEAAANSLAASTEGAATKVFDFDVTATAENWNLKMQEFAATVGPPTQEAFKTLAPADLPSTWSLIIANVKTQLLDMANFVKQVSNTMVQSIRMFSAGLGTAFASVGANLANGQAGFKDFGKILLGVLGDIAIQFGTTFILMGIAKTLLFDPTGPALMAAGAALAVAGGALKAMAGGGGVSAGPAAAGAGVGANSAGGGGVAVSPGFEGTNQQEQEKPGTSVNVVVQGNILDRRQTGLEIAEVINEAFGSNGVQFARSNA